MNDTISTSSLFVCPSCGRSFARREHLKRHVRIHTREKPFRCEDCGKDFSRLDALNRHVSSHESRNAAPVAVVSMRACEQCAASRARCSRQQPCKRCSDRSIPCLYPESKRKIDSTTSPTHIRHRASETYTGQDGNQPPHQSDNSGIHQFQLGGHGLQLHDQGNNWATPIDTAVGPVHSSSNMVGEYPPGPSGLSNINWMSPQGFPAATDWGTQLADFLKQGDVSEPYNTPFPSLPAIEISNTIYSDPFGSNKGASAAPNATSGAYYPPPGANQLSYAQSQSSENTSKSSTNTSTSTEGKYYADGSGYRAPFGGKSKKRYSIANVDVLQPDDDAAAAAAASEPSASSVPQDAAFFAAYGAMVNGMTAEHRLYAGQETEYPTLPTFPQTHFFVQQYFENFHPAFPFLRRSTFYQDASLDWTLLLAVAATGSRYTRHVRGPSLSNLLLDALHKILRRHRYGLGIDQNGVAPFAPGRPARTDTARPLVQTLQAGVLAVMCMLHCGIKTHLDLALIDRHYLVEACSSLGLLYSRPAAVHTFPQNTSPQDLSTWAQAQSEIRTGMMIWILDSIICYEFSARPSMRLSEVQCPLPVDETTWEQSQNEWQPKMSQTVTLHEAMDMLYVEKKIPPDLGELSTCVLLHSIYRRTLEIIAWEQTPLNFWTPTASPMPRPKPSSDERWLPNTAMVSRWRNSACDCFDILHWSANGQVANLSGSEHHNVLLLHLSRLILLAPTSHIQTLATATPARSAAENQDSAAQHAVSRDQVLQWVVRDQYKARLCAIHCGALFWHVRRYSCDSIIEPYGIYISTLILWAFSISSSFVGQDAIDNYAHGETADPSSAAASSSKKEEDDSVPSFLHLDRPLDDELVQIFVRVGHKMSAFIMGIGNIMDTIAPEKILREGIRLLDRSGREGEGATHDEHRGMQERDKCYTWGVEGPYIKSLKQMAQASARRAGSIR